MIKIIFQILTGRQPIVINHNQNIDYIFQRVYQTKSMVRQEYWKTFVKTGDQDKAILETIKKYQS